ncbi:hypothetical protein OIE52_39445 [Streptomyces canus]|uniref:hypothetical protein n=1 Tax=Streptomyces canus TaxID=58343 RepID=UPI003246566F
MAESTNSAQTRPLTVDEQLKMLFARTAKLNDALSALIDPEWGAQTGYLPVTHPLHPDMRRHMRREAEAANASAVLQPAEASAPVDSCEHLKQMAEFDEALTRVRGLSTEPEVMSSGQEHPNVWLHGYKCGVLAAKAAARPQTEETRKP